MNSLGIDPVPALVGGIISSYAGNVLGITNPIFNVIGIGLGGLVTSKLSHFFNNAKDFIPGMYKINEMTDSLNSLVGLKYFTIIINKDDNVIYNKIESYLLHKYSDKLVSSRIDNSDSNKLTLTMENAIFSRSVIEYYKGQKILFGFGVTNEIHIKSQTLVINDMKEYIKEIISTKIGVKTICIHQPSIEVKINEKNKKNIETPQVNWLTFKIQTNKNLTNTILTKTVKKEFLDDLDHFINNEDYYNKKGIPYKRGYLLSGLPGTGKSSIIKSIASHYGMDIFLINLGEIKNEKELTMVFQGTRSCNGYHILCFEDIDRCEILSPRSYTYDKDNEKASAIRTFLNELDGIVECPKRITILTANNPECITKIPALIRPGRIDKHIELSHCDAQQVNDLYNHFSDTGKKLALKELKIQITPAQIIKFISMNPKATIKDMEKELSEKGVISTIAITDSKLSQVSSKIKGRRWKSIRDEKKKLEYMIKFLNNCPKRLEKQSKKVENAKLALVRFKAKKKKNNLVKNLCKKRKRI